MDKVMTRQLLYHETCKYVERVQEALHQEMDAETWDRVVHEIMDQMAFLIPSGPSATVNEENNNGT